MIWSRNGRFVFGLTALIALVGCGKMHPYVFYKVHNPVPGLVDSLVLMDRVLDDTAVLRMRIACSELSLATSTELNAIARYVYQRTEGVDSNKVLVTLQVMSDGKSTAYRIDSISPMPLLRYRTDSMLISATSEMARIKMNAVLEVMRTRHPSHQPPSTIYDLIHDFAGERAQDRVGKAVGMYYLFIVYAGYPQFGIDLHWAKEFWIKNGLPRGDIEDPDPAISQRYLSLIG